MRRIFFVLLVTVTLAPAVGAGRADAAPSAPAASADAGLARGALAKINAFRHAHALREVRLSAPLTTAASTQTNAMGLHGFFAHESYGGGARASKLWQAVAPAPQHETTSSPLVTPARLNRCRTTSAGRSSTPRTTGRSIYAQPGMRVFYR